jgi:hypothetical protein
MPALITVEAVAIALLGVLVAGLLRSHAEILRALRDAGIATGHEPDSPRTPVPAHRPSGASGSDIVGVTPEGESAAIGVVGAQHDTVLAFLTTGCITCAGFWRAFADRGADALGGADGAGRVVIVTRDASEESESKVRELAPRRVPVVMSSGAWADYGVPGAPYFVQVHGASGRITGEGTASGWEQLMSLLGQAAADGAGAAARTDAEREARADRDLLAAGYQPGDPRLHPEPGTPAGG